jgi:hypothetical protein
LVRLGAREDSAVAMGGDMATAGKRESISRLRRRGYVYSDCLLQTCSISVRSRDDPLLMLIISRESSNNSKSRDLRRLAGSRKPRITAPESSLLIMQSFRYNFKVYNSHNLLSPQATGSLRPASPTLILSKSLESARQSSQLRPIIIRSHSRVLEPRHRFKRMEPPRDGLEPGVHSGLFELLGILFVLVVKQVDGADGDIGGRETGQVFPPTGNRIGGTDGGLAGFLAEV